MAVHAAIRRRVREGCEKEFEEALLDFAAHTLGAGQVEGVHLIKPLPGSGQRDYGIIRSFPDEEAMRAFYASDAFGAWTLRVKDMVEGEPERRILTGLEAWFENAPPPPKWKMAIATYLGAFVASLLLSFSLGPLLKDVGPIVHSAVFSAGMVILLTWVLMPVIVRLLGAWLHPSARKP